MKALLAFKRQADENDSRGSNRDEGVIIKGASVPATIDRQSFDQAICIGAYRQEAGALVFKSETVTAKIIENDETLAFQIISTRGDAPVTTRLNFEKQGGRLVLGQSFAKHRNAALDDQHINAPKMLRFAMQATYEEIGRLLSPNWWEKSLAAYYYDEANKANTRADLMPAITVQDDNSVLFVPAKDQAAPLYRAKNPLTLSQLALLCG